MSRILKRPMFRIGGQANEDGIMSTVVPHRAHYADPTGAASTEDNYDNSGLNLDSSGNIDTSTDAGKAYARNVAIMRAAAGPGRSERDRALDLLLRGSIKLASQRPVGNIFSTAAKAFEEPVDQYLKSGQEEENLQRQIKVGSASTAISSADAQALQRLKIKAMYANQTAEAMTEKWAQEFKNSNFPGIQQNSHAAATEVVNFMKKNPNEPTPRIVGPTGPKDKNGNPTWLSRDTASIAEGDVYFNPTTFKIEKKTKAGPVIYNRSTGAFEAPIASVKPVAPAPSVNTPDARTWNKQRFWEEYYKNNPKEKTKQTAEASINTDTDIG
jgi:hypothetical protein